MSRRLNRIPIMLTDNELQRVDDFRFKSRVGTRAGAIRGLINTGLASAELLEALTRLTIDCKIAGIHEQAGFDCWISMAEQAIAKAEGRT